MKKILFKLLKSPLAGCLKLLSRSGRVNFISEITGLAVSDLSPRESLELLLELDNRLYAKQSRAARDYGEGIHPKHRHLNYHQFFIKHLNSGERVLDIGSGMGVMAYDMAVNVPDLKVVGLEMNGAYLEYARQHYQHPNLTFVRGDVLEGFPDQEFDVVTFSNVLEHLEQRVQLLEKMAGQIRPKRIIIRVPLFERDWRVPLKKEIGVDYRLDSTHHIEYTQEEFLEEIRAAGLKVVHMEIRWGEIWAVAEILDTFID